ncbi:MAG: carboxylesterase family protein [Fibrobacter sp.]|nr:carboxylesterase family protein [Fibrobacter sp.]
MKRFLLLSLCLAVSVATAAERYKDRMFSVEKSSDVVFAKNVPHLSEYHMITNTLLAYQMLKGDATVAYFYTDEGEVTAKNLLMDLYMPKGDTETDRAAVIVSHGGAMVAGSKDDYAQHTVNYCDSLAARGYVTASIEYRLGVTLTGENYQLHIDSVDFARAVYRGVQDVRAAVRYFRANAKKLGINPNRIYLVGNSAGAILSLENLYARSRSDFPSYIDKQPLLGGLDDYGEKASYANANAVAALWGAVHNIDMIGDNDTPVLLIHGTADETVYFKTGRPLSNVAHVLENIIPSELGATAASYTLDLMAPTLYGSYVIDSVLTKKGVAHETYFVEGAEHEFYDEGDYTATVQKKVFDFLYNLTQKPAGLKPVVLAKASRVRMGEGNLSFTVDSDSPLSYRVIDLRGRAVLNGLASKGEVVDLSNLGKGVFVLQVRGERAVRFGIAR